MRRKFELEEEMRTAVKTPDNTVVGYSLPVAYSDPLPSPAPAFTKLDQLPSGPTGYWYSIRSQDVPPNVAGLKTGPDAALPDFSKWIGPGPAVSHAPAYQSFDLGMSNSLTFQDTSSSVYSIVPSESTSAQNHHSPLMHEPQMLMPQPIACGHASGIDRRLPLPQQPKQASAMVLQQQRPMYSHSAVGNSALQPTSGLATSEHSLVLRHSMTEYRQQNPAVNSVTVCSFTVSSALLLISTTETLLTYIRFGVAVMRRSRSMQLLYIEPG